MSRTVLEVKDLQFRIGLHTVLNSVSLTLREGSISCLLGPSGCGKTTLLRCIAGFEEVDDGSIILNQKLVSSRDRSIPPEKRKIGVLFQDYALFPHMTVADNIGFGIRHLPKSERQEKIRHLLQSVDLLSYEMRFPHELSGGQQQRVALARALAPEPELLLLDEPFSNLDQSLREKLKHELKVLLETFAVTALIVTHNQDEAFDMADEIGVMAAGRIVQWGSAYDLYHRPKSRVVAEFLGTGAFLPATIDPKGCLESELGELVCAEDMKNLRGNQVTVLLRPDDIVHDDESPSRALVKRVAFRGMYRIYTLALPSGAEIQCFTSSHHEIHSVGTLIGIRLDLKHAVILHREETLVEEMES